MWSLKEILEKLETQRSYVIDPNAKIILTQEQLGEALSSNFEDAMEVLADGSLLRALQAVDESMADKLINYQRDFLSPEVLLFCLQYDLNPNLPFSYRDIAHREIRTLGEAILSGKAEKELWVQSMRHQLMSFYVKLKKIDVSSPEIYEGVLFTERYLDTNADVAYVTLGYYLSERKFYRFQNRRFLSVTDFYRYLAHRKLFKAFARTMEQDLLFFGWLYYLGNVDTVERWLKTVGEIDALAYQEGNATSTEAK